jgi:hypothetical protein
MKWWRWLFIAWIVGNVALCYITSSQNLGSSGLFPASRGLYPKHGLITERPDVTLLEWATTAMSITSIVVIPVTWVLLERKGKKEKK